jgi:hypothetical protein
MRGLAICAMAALVTACATPTLTYNRISAVDGRVIGNIEGQTVIAMPIARLDITPKPRAANGRASTDAPEFTLRYEDNRELTFAVEAQDNLLALTEITPTYRADIASPSSIGVETYDRSAELAEAVAEVVSIAGDPTFLASADRTGGSPHVSCLGLSNEWLGDEVGSQGRDGKTAYAAYWDSDTCYITAEIGDLPQDAVLSEDFTDRWNGNETNFVITPVCRRVSINYYAGTSPLRRRGPALAEGDVVPSEGHLDLSRARLHRWSNFMPDPNYIRLTPLPRQGTLKMENMCSPPSIERGDDPPASLASRIAAVFNPFRNP